MEKCYLKSVRLYPTLFYVDAWICRDNNKLAKIFHKYYGASVEYYKEDILDDYVSTVNSTNKSVFKGDKRIILKLYKMDIGTLIHELNHVYYHLCNTIMAKISYDSQEWHSYMLEYLYEELKSISKFELIND